MIKTYAIINETRSASSVASKSIPPVEPVGGDLIHLPRTSFGFNL